jgi:hypothetical protein
VTRDDVFSCKTSPVGRSVGVQRVDAGAKEPPIPSVSMGWLMEINEHAICLPIVIRDGRLNAH